MRRSSAWTSRGHRRAPQRHALARRYAAERDAVRGAPASHVIRRARCARRPNPSCDACRQAAAPPRPVRSRARSDGPMISRPGASRPANPFPLGFAPQGRWRRALQASTPRHSQARLQGSCKWSNGAPGAGLMPDPMPLDAPVPRVAPGLAAITPPRADDCCDRH